MRSLMRVVVMVGMAAVSQAAASEEETKVAPVVTGHRSLGKTPEIPHCPLCPHHHLAPGTPAGPRGRGSQRINRSPRRQLPLGPEGSAVLPALTQALKDSDAGVRLVAVSALDQFSGPKAIPALKTALKDGVSAVHQAAQDALERLGEIGLDDRLKPRPPTE